MMKNVAPDNIRHVKVCGRKDTFCAHPVEAGEIYYFGNGEIAFMHLHTDNVEYDGKTIIAHGQGGIHGSAKVVLTRSYDGGLTWKDEDQVVIFDQGLPLETQQKMLSNRMVDGVDAPLTEDSIIHWGKSFCGPLLPDGKRREIVSFMVHSEDKGHTWSEKVVVPINIGFSMLLSIGAPLIRQGNRWLKCFVASRTPGVDNNSDDSIDRCVLYSSENGGITWQYVSNISRDVWGEDAHSYPTLLDLGDGHLIAFAGCWKTPCCITRWISCCHSYDNGLNWTAPVRIQSFGISPYALRLRDGRILLVYAKREPSTARGMYGILSDDQGKTWSNEFVIRHGDCTSEDLGYPVAIETEDNHIFMGYYYTVEDGQKRGGARHIAGTLFTI